MKNINELRNSRIAIVGSGYIGKNLLRKLNEVKEELNLEIQVFTRTNMDQLANQEFDHVYCCTGNTGDFRTKIWETVDSNILVIKYIIENVKIIKSMVVLSSTRLYGFSERNDISFSEFDDSFSSKNHLNLDFVYDGTKMLMESILFNQFNHYQFKIIICRLSNVFGKFEVDELDDSTYLKYILKHKLLNTKFEAKLDIKGKKDFVHVDDAIEGLILSSIHSTSSTIYNIASGFSLSWQDWFDFLEIKPQTVAGITSFYSNIDISKAKKEIGYEPSFSMEKLNINQLINNYDGSNR